MKPRIFIGSSVEGLNVAYAIQQNLTHNAEVTVWDQGVFELSRTTIESLIDILSKSDFGIFVFSADDVSKIRKVEKNVVRDNVLFEFGLFIGKLGRERVFFVLPIGSDLHLPTDLIGITPGRFDPNRQDNSLQAATGPVCHQIRNQIAKLGLLLPVENSSEPDKKIDIVENNEEKGDWLSLFLSKDFDAALTLLVKEYELKDDLEKIQNKIWQLYCQLRTGDIRGIESFEQLLAENPDNLGAHQFICRIFYWEDFIDIAIKVLEEKIPLFNNDEDLIITLSDCYSQSRGEEASLNYLFEINHENNIAVSLKIVSIYESQKNYELAREVIHRLYRRFPNNEKVRSIYSSIAHKLNLNEIALFFLSNLTIDYPNNSSYWGQLSNTCLNLDFYDLAMFYCRKADELASGKEAWINSNLGNILNNKGFFSEAIKYLEKSVELNESEYAHDRLSKAIKSKKEEKDKMNAIAKKGRILLNSYIPSSKPKSENNTNKIA